MRISFNNSYNSTSFCKKDGNIKKADELQRQTRLVFPVISSTYAENFYNCLDKKIGSKPAAVVANRTLANRIYGMRDDFSYIEKLAKYCRFDAKMMYILDKISKERAGNCMENARLALAVLCANGYYNSSLAGLRYEIQFVNKETGETEYKASTFLDHAFAVTDLNKREKRDIVIDPWLGFAGYEQEAFSKFKSLFEEELDDLLTMHKKLFRIEKIQAGELSNQEEMDFSDYEIRKSFAFIESFSENGDLKEKQRLGELVREKYPDAVLNAIV